MQINIEIGGPIADAINRLADALISAKQADTIIEKASTSSKPKAKKEAPAAPAPEAEPVAETPAPVEPEKAAPSGPTRDDAKAALLSLVKAKGHPAGMLALGKFGATKLGELKEEDLAAFIAEVAELVQ
jgi:hypothetical protein